MPHDRSLEKISLYFHWPFCCTRCSYCPFIALAKHEEYFLDYHKALLHELILSAQKTSKMPIRSVYIGGGTPSLWPDQLLLDMSGTIDSTYDMSTCEEWTIEVNPGSIRPEQGLCWRKAGINRVSIGIQYTDEAILASLNRYQTNDDVEQALNNVSHYFSNISVDIMLGLPGVREVDWQQFLKTVVTWPITHISLYCLMVHEKTPLYYRCMRGDVTMPSDTMIADAYCWSIEFLRQHGFHQYEVSNFARPGFHSRHNRAYWDRLPYKGFGLGACSFDGEQRTANVESLLIYLDALKRGLSPIATSETLTQEQVRLEKILLGLRQTLGVPLDEIYALTGESRKKYIQENLAALVKQGYVTVQENRVMLTPAGFVVEQSILQALT